MKNKNDLENFKIEVLEILVKSKSYLKCSYQIAMLEINILINKKYFNICEECKYYVDSFKS